MNNKIVIANNKVFLFWLSLTPLLLLLVRDSIFVCKAFDELLILHYFSWYILYFISKRVFLNSFVIDIEKSKFPKFTSSFKSYKTWRKALSIWNPSFTAVFWEITAVVKERANVEILMIKACWLVICAN